MEAHPVRVLSTEKINHNVLRIKTRKPETYSFIPGQATDLSINRDGWKDQLRAFTFTSLPADPDLEFHIKTYPERKSVTAELLNLKPGDELLLHEVFGAITYRGEGVFIAGGAGVTPFIAILRFLNSQHKTGKNKLIFANTSRNDILLEEEFANMLGPRFVNILSGEKVDGYYTGFISEQFLRDQIPDFSCNFYVCGPPPMMENVLPMLKNLGVDDDRIIVEF